MLSKKNPPIRIRLAKRKDAASIARLSGQLGYPTTTAEMGRRLSLVLCDKHAACFVAETVQPEVIGWVHVSVCPLLEVARRVEVNGLVVDEQVRSRGAGWLLLEAAENWTLKMKCRTISVRSNVVRERAHGFYQKHGYEHYKTQKAFRKSF